MRNQPFSCRLLRILLAYRVHRRQHSETAQATTGTPDARRIDTHTQRPKLVLPLPSSQKTVRDMKLLWRRCSERSKTTNRPRTDM